MSGPGPVKLPSAVAAVLSRLSGAGHEAHLVGPGARALIEGRDVRDFEVATSATAEALLDLFSVAVPLDAAASRLLLPCADGALELVPYRYADALEGELAHRDFTLHAAAVDAEGRVQDPFGADEDATRGRLRAVGDARERLAEDPLRALRAARWIALRGLEADDALVEAARERADRVKALPAARLREELHAILLGAHVERGLIFLARTGLGHAVAPGTAEDGPRVVAALPADLDLRLAGWLRGTRAVRILRRLREPRERVVEIERLLHLHPIDAGDGGVARVRRLARRSGPRLTALLALREAEISARGEGADAGARLARLREVARTGGREGEGAVELALDGRDVMDILGCPPGPLVGRALGQLRKAVEADPSCNTAETLRERLLAWRATREDGDRGRSR